MPLVLRKDPERGSMLGVWEILEPEEWFSSSLTLGDADRRQLGEIRREQVRLQRLACRKILSELLGKEDIEIAYDPHGKPFLAGVPGHISFSHSDRFAAAIYSATKRVGIDIEKKGDRILRVAGRFMTEEELLSSQGMDYLDKLYIHWGAKEALYKLYGDPGLSIHQDIILSPFDYLCNREGNCTARVRTGDAFEASQLTYLVTDPGFLVYSLK